MNNPLFTGVCTALVTPFLDGRINYPMVQVLLKRQQEAGVKAVILAGTTGESSTLSDDEKLELIRRAKDHMGNDMTMIAGTGSNDTAHAIELSQAAQEEGADALLIVSPYYNKATPEGLYAHYLAIAHTVSIPILVYNVPSRTGMDIPVSVYRRISHIPNIAGVKEASTDITKIAQIRNACNPSFTIWSGNDDLVVPMIAMGAKGAISVASNVVPMEYNDMVQAALAGDFDTASDLQCRLTPLLQLLFCEVNPIPVKAAMARIGLDCGQCRLPLTALSEKNQLRLDAFFG